jgi:mono/diheme cytochrome c family protein
VRNDLGKPGGSLALVVAIAAAVSALVSAYGFSRLVRHHSLRASNQAPTAEAWVLETVESSPEAVRDGRKLFLSSCAHCHGADATGDEGPDLHGIEASDRYLANIVTRGVKGEMPSFKKKLKAPDIVRLTAYLRSLGET